MEAQMVKTETALEMKRVFQAPVNKVYRAWTEAEMMNQWYHPGPEMHSVCQVDLRVGGRYEVQMHGPEGDPYIVGGEYREIIPQKKLVFTWKWQGMEEESLVTVLFKESTESETELTLIHERFSADESIENHAEGWMGTLAQLAVSVEG